MPVVGDHEIARQIRAEPGFEEVLIVVVSGYGDSQARKSLEAEINHHLVKPIEFKDVQHILASELDHDRRTIG
jgi:CheY-like chemotaxis protein